LNRILQQSDLDRAALQVEITDYRKREKDLQSKLDSLDERLRGLSESYQEAMSVSESLNSDLKEERRRNVDLEHRLKSMDVSNRERSEVRCEQPF
jgi:peptidoglycan hydrolase CwlO-like protein